MENPNETPDFQDPGPAAGYRVKVDQVGALMGSSVIVTFTKEQALQFQQHISRSITPHEVIGEFFSHCGYSFLLTPVPVGGVSPNERMPPNDFPGG